MARPVRIPETATCQAGCIRRQMETALQQYCPENSLQQQMAEDHGACQASAAAQLSQSLGPAGVPVERKEYRMGDAIHWVFGPNQQPMVSGHQLHDALGSRLPYNVWFMELLMSGFEKGTDYVVNDRCSSHRMLEGVTAYEVDHLLTVGMAKEVCALAQSETGRTYRRFFKAAESYVSGKQPLIMVIRELREKLAKAEADHDSMQRDMQTMKERLAAVQNRAQFCEWVISHPGEVSITEIAGLYGWTANQMNGWLQKQHVQYRQDKSWFLCKDLRLCGYTRSERHTKRDGSGKVWPQVRQVWTQKGRLFIYDLMREAGYLPLALCEQEDMDNV